MGGGLGRTPMIGKVIREFLPKADLLPYVEAIVSVYNLLGRRDNKYKARIKITVHETGMDEIRDAVEARFADMRRGFRRRRPGAAGRDRGSLRAAGYVRRRADAFDAALAANPAFRSWVDTNLDRAQEPGLRHRLGLAEAARRDARRRDGRPDAADRRSRRALRPRRTARSATSRTSSCRMCARPTCRRFMRPCAQQVSRRPISA